MDWKMLGFVAALGSTGCMDLHVLQGGVQGSGKSATEHRSVSKFSSIDAKGAFDVDVQVGSPASVTITGDDNLLKLVQSKVEAGTLVLNTTRSVNTMIDMRVKITVPSLKDFSLRGAGDVNIVGVKQDKISLHLYGAGDLTATGSVRELDVDLYGAGDMELFDLRAQNATATLKGAGDMNIYASHKLDAKVYGVGDITYKGHPKTVVKSASGLGDISSAD
jgi:hypothetical protein